MMHSAALQDQLGPHMLHLYRFALGKLRDRASAEELVQETLLAALEHGHSFAGRSALRTWLTAILKHKIIDMQRTHTRRYGLMHASSTERDSGEAHELAAPHSVWSDPEYALEHKRLVAAFDAAVANLPEAAARVFEMRELLGISTAEVSKALGITENNCCVILHRARHALRHHLHAQGINSVQAASA